MTATILVIGLAPALSAIMAGAWFTARRTQKSGWIDTIWSFAIGLLGIFASLVPLHGEMPTSRQILVAVMALLWSARLGWHIAGRTLRGDDDPRYAQLRQEWGEHYHGRLFWFLQIQAAAAFLLVLSILIAAHNPGRGFRFGDWLGIVIFIAALVGEAVADRQLSRFSANPDNKGRVCDTGLWGLSRHPNYFFEWLVWIAYAVVAIDISGAYAWGWLAFVGPVFMYWLLTSVSGIPPLESHLLRSRGPAFRRYQARVNAFWPGPPHRVGSTLEESR